MTEDTLTRPAAEPPPDGQPSRPPRRGLPLVVDAPGAPLPNARRFLRTRYAHPDRALLVCHGGAFHAWDGTCWPETETARLRAELYRFFEHAVHLVPDKESELVETPFSPTRRKIADLDDALRAVAFLPGEITAPAWLDGGNETLSAGELVACTNGLVHVPTRTLHPLTPRFYVHHAVPFAFNPTASRPARWLGFLEELWADDGESIGALQELFGYLIAGGTSLQKLFLIVGPKRSGKGTIGRVLTALLGAHHVAGPTLAGLATNFGLSPLIGKPVALIADARLRTGQDVVTERLLSISGEDTLTVDRKYRQPWTGRLPTRIVILSNELPRLPDSSGALASRFVILTMTRSFYGHENPALTDQLLTELPAIFNWALDGLTRLRGRGHFLTPAASRAPVEELEDLGSPIAAFIRDRCTLGAGQRVRADVLYSAWRAWCDEQGRDHPGNVQTFGRDLRASQPGLTSVQTNTAGIRIRHYQGIALMGETTLP